MSYMMAHWAALNDGPRIRFINTRGSHHIVFAPFFFSIALLQVLWLGVTRRAAVLHINVSANGSALRKFFVVALASLLRLPMLLHVHDGSLDRFYLRLPSALQAALRWMFQQADCVVVLGDFWHRFVVAQLGVPRERVEIIRNGVPAPLLAPSRLEGTCGSVHIVFLGRLCEAKGIPELLAAFASQQVARLDWHATLAGDGCSDGYRKKVHDDGLGERIAFPGWLGRPEVDRLLGEADILVLPSHFEGLPVAVLEALANGVAVICTPVGGLPDFLLDRHSVLFVGPGDTAALAAALAELIAFPELRARLAAGGRGAFREHFDVATAAGKFLHIYRRLGGVPVPSEPAFPARMAPGETTGEVPGR